MNHFTTQQLHEQGLSTYMIKKHVESGQLIRLSRGAYVSKGAQAADQLMALASTMKEPVFTGKAALAVHGYGQLEFPALIRHPHRSTQRHGSTKMALRNGSAFTRFIHSTEVPSTTHLGPRLVTVAQAVADGLSFENLSTSTASDALSRAYFGTRGKAAFDRDFNEVHSNVRQQLLEIAQQAMVGTASKWEKQMVGKLRKRGLFPEVNVKIGGYIWDLYFKEAATVVELDSLMFHAPSDNNDTFLVSMWKYNQAIELGLAPLRFSDDCTRYHMDATLNLIERVVRHRSHMPGISKKLKVADPLLMPAWGFHAGISYSQIC